MFEALKHILNGQHSVRFGRSAAAHDRRWPRRLHARHSAQNLGVARRPNNHDDHREGRRCGIRVGQGMVPRSEIHHPNSQGRPGYGTRAPKSGTGTRAGTSLLLVCRPSLPRRVLSQRRRERSFRAPHRISNFPHCRPQTNFPKKIRHGNCSVSRKNSRANFVSAHSRRQLLESRAGLHSASAPNL